MQARPDPEAGIAQRRRRANHKRAHASTSPLSLSTRGLGPLPIARSIFVFAGKKIYTFITVSAQPTLHIARLSIT